MAVVPKKSRREQFQHMGVVLELNSGDVDGVFGISGAPRLLRSSRGASATVANQIAATQWVAGRCGGAHPCAVGAQPANPNGYSSPCANRVPDAQRSPRLVSFPRNHAVLPASSRMRCALPHRLSESARALVVAQSVERQSVAIGNDGTGAIAMRMVAPLKTAEVSSAPSTVRTVQLQSTGLAQCGSTATRLKSVVEERHSWRSRTEGWLRLMVTHGLAAVR